MISNVIKVDLKVTVMILVLLVLVLATQQKYTDSVHKSLLTIDAQTEKGTFALWRINDAVPGEEVTVAISDDVDIWDYTFVVPDNLPTHPNNPTIKYYDFHTYLPATLKENEMVIMCVTPTYKDQGFQCTETFVTKNMARGIVYYVFEVEFDPSINTRY